MKTYKRIYAEVDLDAIAHNMEAMQANLAEGVGMIGVVKAEGYGHGSVPVARAITPYVAGYAVATAEEALLLKRHGIEKMILVLGAVHESWYEELIRSRIRPAVFRYEEAEKLSDKAVSMKVTAAVHIAVDTGMGRIGLAPTQESAGIVARMSRLPGIWIEGVFTHFAKADERDKGPAGIQLKKYQDFVKMLEERGVEIPIRHCCNSAGIIDMRCANLDMVRAGISIYGLYPSGEVDREAVRLEPALSLRSFITYVKTVGPGTEISYGGTFTAEREMEVATISAGYGDGYPRNLSGKGDVLIRGRRAPVLGRVCMDQFMADVTGIGAREGDLVTLIGRDGTDQITVEELAGRGGGFHYEILCDIGKRVPRVYLRGGKVVGTKDYFDDCYQEF